MTNVIIGETYDSAATNLTGLTGLEIGLFAGDAPDKKCLGAAYGGVLTQSFSSSPRQLVLKRIPAVAGVKQIWTVTYSAYGQNTYDEFQITVDVQGYRNDKSQHSNVKTHSVTGVYANATALYTALAAAINADANAPYQASVSSGVAITPKTGYEDMTMKVAAAYFPYPETTVVSQTISATITTAYVASSGYKGDIQPLLKAHAPFAAGNMQYNDRDIPQLPIFDSDGAYASYPFDILYIGWLDKNHIDGNGLGKTFSPDNEIYILMPDSSAELEELQDALQTFFGKTFENEYSA